MKKKIVTEHAEIEVLAHRGEAISLCISDAECGGQTCCSWLNDEQAASLADALIAAIEICYPNYMESLMIEEEDE